MTKTSSFDKFNTFIPVSSPSISQIEIDLVTRAISDGWISSGGPYVKEFEASLASYYGLRDCVALSNGTAALETALYALGIGDGDEIIIPSFAIISLAVAIIRLNAIPVLVDVDPSNWNIDPKAFERAITKKTKAVVIVHSFGRSADMQQIMQISKAHDLFVVEDIAEAIGSKYQGQLCGTFGDIATSSFYANKLITSGEGGCVLSNNMSLIERARNYINLCFGTKERFCHSDIGYNFRLTNIQAAVALGQLSRISSFIEKKKLISKWYEKHSKNINGIDLVTLNSESVYWMFCFLINEDSDFTGINLVRVLEQENVGSRTLFRGLHDQTSIKDKVVKSKEYPVTDYLYQKGIYLPSGLNLLEEEVEAACFRLNKVLSG